MAVKKKLYIKSIPNEYLYIIGIVVLLGAVLVGTGNLKLGSWFAPAQQLKVDLAGIHFYSGYSAPTPLTWHLENEYRKEQNSIQVTALGYYNFPLPNVSGSFHLYCTGSSGCDAGDWFLVNLSTVPASPANAPVTGLCGYSGTGNAEMCSGASSEFRLQTAQGLPSKISCNTCVPRDINNVPGYDTSAKIISAPQLLTTEPIPGLIRCPLYMPMPPACPNGTLQEQPSTNGCPALPICVPPTVSPTVKPTEIAQVEQTPLGVAIGAIEDTPNPTQTTPEQVLNPAATTTKQQTMNQPTGMSENTQLAIVAGIILVIIILVIRLTGRKK